METQSLSNCHALICYTNIMLYSSRDGKAPLLWNGMEVMWIDIVTAQTLNHRTGRVKSSTIGANIAAVSIKSVIAEIEPDIYRISEEEFSKLLKNGIRTGVEISLDDTTNEDSEYINSDKELYDIIHLYNCRNE